MVKRNPYVLLFFFIFSLIASLSFINASSADQSPKNVLLLTSYHQGDRWNDSVVQGVRETLESHELVRLSIEHLDMRRYNDPGHTRMTTEYIRAKYQSKPQDLILVSDDPALDFLLTLRDDLFPNTPVVFCGINNFTAKRIQGQSNITGVNEALSLEATIDLVLKLFPKTTRIMAVVSDTEANGRTNLEQYRAAAARMKGRVQFDELLNITDKTAPDILSRLPKDSLVLRLINLLNSEGGYVSLQDSIRMISTHAPVPVFTPWSFDLGDGALGGYVSSGRDQGYVAGNLAIRILEGQEAEQIPVVMESPNVPMFDYKVLERFGIKESALPKGSVVLNHQVSMLEQYWGWLLGIALFCCLQMFLIVTLLTHGKKLRAANAALQDSEVQFKAMVETVPMAIHLTTGVEQITQYVNPTMVKLFGYTQEDIPSVAQWWPLAYPDASYRKQVAEEWTRRVQRAIDTQSPIEPMEVVVHCKDGSEKNISWGYITLGDKNYSCGLDLTERKRAEKALRESEERLRAIFQAARNVSFIITDMEDPVPNILEFSPGAETIFRYDKSEVIGKPVSILHLPQDVVKFPQAHEQMRHGITGFSGETTLVRKSGEQFPALFSTYPLFDLHGEVYAGLGVSFDISEKQKLESQLLQAQKMDSVGRLAGGVAHDFNNMLGAILGYTELAMELVEPDNPLHANLEKIQGAAQRSADLTRQLLTFARKQTVSPKVIDLNGTIESMLTLLRRLIGEDIDLAWRPGKEVWPVKIDPAQVDQILANLCVNARDAIVDTGKVTIETGMASFDEDYCARHAGFVPGDYALMAVSDDGSGMDAETLSHLFEPFFTTKELGKGTGLGLATVYGAVKQNNGFVNVYSDPGQGTTFTIYLPRHLDKTDLLPEKELDEPVERGHETVLLVEDESVILEMTTIMLTRMGYTVLAAETPSNAIRLAQEHPGRIDLLLTDVVMPEMNGRDLAKNLLSLYPNLKRLFMSGYTANVIAHHGVLDEGVHFIQKPFSKGDLAGKLREALEDRQVDLVTGRAEG